MPPDVLELYDFKRDDVKEICYDFPHTARQIDTQGRNEACPGSVASESYTPVSRLQDVRVIDPITIDVLELWDINRNDVKENRIFLRISPEKSTRKTGTKRVRLSPPRRRIPPSPGYKTTKIDPIPLDFLELWAFKRNDVTESRIFFRIPYDKSTCKARTKLLRVQSFMYRPKKRSPRYLRWIFSYGTIFEPTSRETTCFFSQVPIIRNLETIF